MLRPVFDDPTGESRDLSNCYCMRWRVSLHKVPADGLQVSRKICLSSTIASETPGYSYRRFTNIRRLQYALGALPQKLMAGKLWHTEELPLSEIMPTWSSIVVGLESSFLRQRIKDGVRTNKSRGSGPIIKPGRGNAWTLQQLISPEAVKRMIPNSDCCLQTGSCCAINCPNGKYCFTRTGEKVYWNAAKNEFHFFELPMPDEGSSIIMDAGTESIVIYEILIFWFRKLRSDLAGVFILTFWHEFPQKKKNFFFICILVFLGFN